MGSRGFRQEASTKSSSHGTAITAEWAGSQKPKNKQSLDYVLRTGLAGGLAGCAVNSTLLSSVSSYVQYWPRKPGQNRCRSARSREDPLPGIQPPVCQIHRIMVRRRHGDARHQPTRRRARVIPRTLGNTPEDLPLRRDQIPHLRASPSYYNTVSSPGNPFTPPLQRIDRGSDLSLDHVPPGSDSCSTSIRDKTRFAVLVVEYLQTDLPWTSAQACLLDDPASGSRRCDPGVRSRELLSRLLAYIGGHGSLRRNVVSHAWHCGRLVALALAGTVYDDHLHDDRQADFALLGRALVRRVCGTGFSNGCLSAGSYQEKDAGRRSSGWWPSLGYGRNDRRDMAGTRMEGILRWLRDWVCQGGSNGRRQLFRVRERQGRIGCLRWDEMIRLMNSIYENWRWTIQGIAIGVLTDILGR